MSLINQMLRDLESRRSNAGDEPSAAELPQPVDFTHKSRRRLWLAAGALVLIGLIWFGREQLTADRLTTQQQLSPSPPAETTAPTVSLLAAVSTAPQAAKEPVSPVTPAEVVSTPPVAPVEPLQIKPAEGLQLLSLGIIEAADGVRLMLEFPRAPNYQLLNDGQDGQALKLLFPATTIGTAMTIPQSHGSLVQGLKLVQQQQDLLLLVALQAPVQLRALTLPTDAYYGQRLLLELTPRIEAGDQPDPAGKTLSADLPAPVEVPVEMPVVVKRLSKTESLTPEQQAGLNYQTGLAQWRAGNGSSAVLSFSQALALQPQLVEARLQLIELLLQQQDKQAAEQQLQTGLRLQPESRKLRKRYAHLLLAAQRLSEAIGVLSAPPVPVIAADLEYYALWAALLQENGQHGAAGKVYAQLLEVRPREALWWLGLATSEEQAGAPAAAQKAYQQALQFPGLRPDLEKYIRDRLQVL
jgi:tetratricopeptide (TPR) repeat protein